MELLRLYPDCRTLEAWSDVRERLVASGIRPIRADMEWIDESITEQRTRTSWIKTVQQQLADERQSEDQASLHRFYDDVRARMKRTGHPAAAVRSASRTSGRSDSGGANAPGVVDAGDPGSMVKSSLLPADTLALHGVDGGGQMVGDDSLAGAGGFSGVVSRPPFG